MLAKLTALSTIFMFSLGLVSGLLMQAEALTHGVSIFSRDAIHLYILARQIHIAALGLGLPLCFIGGTTCLIWQKHAPASALPRIVGYILIAAGIGLFLFVSFYTSRTGQYPLQSLTRQTLIPLAAFIPLIVAIFVSIMVRGNRFTKLLYCGLGLLAGGVFGLLLLVTSNIASGPNIVYATMLAAAMNHAAGLAIISACFASAYNYQASRNRLERSPMSPILSLLVVSVIAVVGAVWIFMQAGIGLQGMPASFINYPPSYSSSRLKISLAAFCMTGICTIAAYRALRLRPVNQADPADVF